MTASKRNVSFLVAALGVYAAGLLAAIRWSPDWTAVQTWAVALTGLVVIWYTWETMQLRLSALAQRELELRPLVVLEPNANGLLARNLGHGVALNVKIDDVVISEKEEVVIRFPRLLPFLAAGATCDVAAESFKRGRSAGDFFLTHLEPEYARLDLRVRIHFQNAEMVNYAVTETIRPGELRIGGLSTG